MNVKACLDLLMARCARRTNPTLRADALLEMTMIQSQMETAENLPWFLISEEATATITEDMIGDPRLPLPTDFIREVEDDNLFIVQDDGTKVEVYKRGYDELRLRHGNAPAAGTPEHYAIRGSYVILSPPPASIMTFQYPSYYAKQDAPVDSPESENAWFKWAPDLMISKTGVVVAGHYLKDAELIQLYGAEQQRAVERLEHLETAREEANRSRRMG